MSVSVKKQFDALARILLILVSAEATNRGFHSQDTLDVDVLYVPDDKTFIVTIAHQGGVQSSFRLVRDFLPALGRKAGEQMLRARVAQAVSYLAEHRGKPGAYRN